MGDNFLISKDAEGTFDEDSLLPAEKKALQVLDLDPTASDNIAAELSLYVQEEHYEELLCHIPCFLEDYCKETREKMHNVNFFSLTAFADTTLLLENSKQLLNLGHSELKVCYKLAFPDLDESATIIFDNKIEIVRFEILKIEKELTKFNLVLKEYNY